MEQILDVDQHLFEPRGAWRDHIDPAFKESALVISDDEQGWPWLSWRGRKLYPVEVQHPGKPELIGAARLAMAAGERAPGSYEDLLPPEYSDPSRRVQALDALGVDASVLFPNYGLLWEDMLCEDLPALCANLTAYNRWIAEQVAQGHGRLFGVAHLTLRDVSWATKEIAACSAAGLRLAMVAPSTVDNKPLSHRDFDPVWQAFCDAGVAPVFHVSNFHRPLDAAWYQAESEQVDKLLDSVMLWVAPAVALADLILHGTLERFGSLRIGVVELTAGWVPRFLLHLDGASDFYAARHGGPLHPLDLRPSEYFRRQVRVASLPYEGPAHLIDLVGPEVFMFGSDWPHAEGVSAPGEAAARAVATSEPAAATAFASGNARWLLRLD